MWHNFFDEIFVINLPERTDRLEETSIIMKEYDIPYKIVQAIKHDKGEIGLVETMKGLFSKCLELGYEKVLIFEDDIRILVSKEELDRVMNICVNDLNVVDWGLFYLGLQICQPFLGKRTPNLLHVQWGQSTHAVAYSKHAMQFIVNSVIIEPIDNFLVNNYQKKYFAFCPTQLLVTQRKNYSDICKDIVDWDLYISGNFERYRMDMERNLNYKQ